MNNTSSSSISCRIARKIVKDRHLYPWEVQSCRIKASASLLSLKESCTSRFPMPIWRMFWHSMHCGCSPLPAWATMSMSAQDSIWMHFRLEGRNKHCGTKNMRVLCRYGHLVLLVKAMLPIWKGLHKHSRTVIWSAGFSVVLLWPWNCECQFLILLKPHHSIIFVKNQRI